MPTRTIVEQYDYIRRISPEFARRIVAAAQKAHNEEEFRYAASNAIAEVGKELGVAVDLRQEYTLATGRADAVYNRFVIEYENPGVLHPNLGHKQTQHAVNQVKDYIAGLAQKERRDRDRLLGVAFDGHYMVFVRYHDGHEIYEEPLEFNRASAERFLRSLFSLASGRALIPENLVEDFGNQNEASRRVTRALYNALDTRANGLPSRLYSQWKLFFGEVAGYEALEGKLKHKGELQQFAQGMGLKPDETDAPRLFFAIHTYFSFLVKSIARLVLQAHAGGALGATPLTTVANLQGEALRRELEKMESGDIFRALGLKNLLEGDFFSWYLQAWNSEVEDALRETLSRLAEYNPATVQDDPHSARDLLKKLYHYLLPREIRHDLGEFYTPDWLAERLLVQLNEPLFLPPKPGKPVRTPNKRILDPACGSGTFLILAIRGLKANCQEAGMAEADTLEVILNSVMGIDLNPLAVLAARVNYLLAVADLLPYRRREVEIPVYLADSILTPAGGDDLFHLNRRILDTAVGKLPVPTVIDSRAEMDKLTDLLEDYVKSGFAPDAFLQRCRADIPDVAKAPESEGVLLELYEKLLELHRQGLDGIWARVLKNAFMPLFLQPFDYVVGNPPWINWESLPQGYREQSAPLWQQYGLVATKGRGKDQFELGKQKRDISTLLFYVAADRYLKDGGKLGFVITQSVWKTGASAPFRRFRIGQGGARLRVLAVDDLSSLQVFEGASTRTSIFVVQKGQPMRYPVQYAYWQKTTKGKSLDYDSTLDEAMALTRILRFEAAPVSESDPTSPWLTARPSALKAVRKILGRSDYQAYLGSNTGGANAVYWLEVATERPDELVVVCNVTEGAKRDVEGVTAEMEQDLLYPLLRGRDVGRWHAVPSVYLLLPHTPETQWQAIDEKQMQLAYPKSFAYLYRFRDVLLSRRWYHLMRQGHPFYIMGNVSKPTFAPWKVVWREVSTDFEPAVIGPVGGKPAIPAHTLVLIDFHDPQEAYYVCALLGSSLYNLAINAYISMHPSPHVLQNIRVPRYDPANPVHARLSALSRHAHELAPAAHAGDKDARAALQDVEDQVDHAAADLWCLTDAELGEIRRNLKDLRG
jgi:hypothetical protein